MHVYTVMIAHGHGCIWSYTYKDMHVRGHECTMYMVTDVLYMVLYMVMDVHIPMRTWFACTHIVQALKLHSHIYSDMVT